MGSGILLLLLFTFSCKRALIHGQVILTFIPLIIFDLNITLTSQIEKILMLAVISVNLFHPFFHGLQLLSWTAGGMFPMSVYDVRGRAEETHGVSPEGSER